METDTNKRYLEIETTDGSLMIDLNDLKVIFTTKKLFNEEELKLIYPSGSIILMLKGKTKEIYTLITKALIQYGESEHFSSKCTRRHRSRTRSPRGREGRDFKHTRKTELYDD
jgi:hypothetical protein